MKIRARASLILALCCASSLARSAAPVFHTQWVGVAPVCAEPSLERLPGQPQVGLVAFKTRCPSDERDRVISAKVSATVEVFSSKDPIARGGAPNAARLERQSALVTTAAQWPLDETVLGLVSARRDLPAGSALAARDFESRLLWRGGETVTIKTIIGSVRVETQGQATSLGREGQRASAKLEGGKIIDGVAKTSPAGSWIQTGQ